MDDAELLREAFRPLAGPGLFRGNVFRLTGLAPGASAADVRRRRSEVQAAARLGLPAPPPAVPAPACGPEPAELEVSAAFDDLRRDPVRRFVHEMLWLWGGSDELAGEHDALVREHCALLAEDWPDTRPVARSAETDRRWSAVLSGWAALLGREDLWRRLEQRAVEYADPRVTSAMVAQLRRELAGRLLAVNVDIAAHTAHDDPAGAGRHVTMLRELPFSHGTVDEAVQVRVRAAKRDVTRATEEATGQAGKDPNTGPAQAEALLARTGGPLRVLAALLGAGDPTAAAAHDEVAGALNSMCIGYYNHSTVDRRARAAAVRTQLQAALELVRDRHVRERITANLETLAQNDAVIEHNVRNSFGLPIRPGPDPKELAERARVAGSRRERERARWAAMLEEREERLLREREERSRRESEEAAQRREREEVERRRRSEQEEADRQRREQVEVERRWRAQEDAERRREQADAERRHQEQIAPPEPRRAEPSHERPSLAQFPTPDPGHAPPEHHPDPPRTGRRSGGPLALTAVAVVLVALLVPALRGGTAWLATGGVVVAVVGIVTLAWSAWRSRPTGSARAGIVASTLLALLAPTAGVIGLLGAWHPSTRWLLIGGVAGLVALLVLRFRGASTRRN